MSGLRTRTLPLILISGALSAGLLENGQAGDAPSNATSQALAIVFEKQAIERSMSAFDSHSRRYSARDLALVDAAPMTSDAVYHPDRQHLFQTGVSLARSRVDGHSLDMYVANTDGTVSLSGSDITELNALVGDVAVLLNKSGRSLLSDKDKVVIRIEYAAERGNTAIDTLGVSMKKHHKINDAVTISAALSGHQPRVAWNNAVDGISTIGFADVDGQYVSLTDHRSSLLDAGENDKPAVSTQILPDYTIKLPSPAEMLRRGRKITTALGTNTSWETPILK